MSINLTLFGQIITFSIFIWFTMKFVWPPIIKAIHDRQKTIADGLAAGERGQRELELAQRKSTEIIREAKLEASHVIEQSHQRSVQIIEEAKEKARVEGQHVLNRASAEVEQLTLSARESLRKELSSLVVAGAEKVLEKEVDQRSHDKLFQGLVETL